MSAQSAKSQRGSLRVRHIARAMMVAELLLAVLPARRAALAAHRVTVAAGVMHKAIISNYERRMIGRPPAALKLDHFYKKYVDAEGIPVTSSALVPDAALLIARDIVVSMLSERPDLRKELVGSGARVGVMAITEMTTDLPEQRAWKKPDFSDARLTPCELKNYAKISKMSDREYWNKRARGMGGLYTTGAAENILGVPGTRYFGENILVHEFSHSIHDAIRKSDPKLASEIDAAYANAKRTGLWKGSYSIQTVEEYWAEGTQFWFNSNMAYKASGTTVTSSRDLERYDPQLYDLLAQVYPASHHIRADVFYMHPARLMSKPVGSKNSC